MNDLVSGAKRGAAAYQGAKAKRDKIKGTLEDISKLHNAAKHLLEYNTSSSSVLLKTAYEGVQRLAERYGAGAPVLTVFFRYHQPHVDLLANVLQAKNEATFAIKWQAACDQKSKVLEGTVDNLVHKNGFAGAMTNENGQLSSNVPKGFRDYCEDDAFDLSTPAREAIQMAKTRPSQQWMSHERERLGRVILDNAHDIACAFMAVANETDKFLQSALKADAYFRKLKKGGTDADAAFGSMAEWTMQMRALSNGGTQAGSTDLQEVQLFTEGKVVSTPSFRRVGKSFRKMENLSENWQRWAKLVSDGSHMNNY